MEEVGERVPTRPIIGAWGASSSPSNLGEEKGLFNVGRKGLIV